MEEDERKVFLKNLSDKFVEVDLENPRYECWDCEKEIQDVDFNMETKKKLARSNDGFLLLICKDCANNEDY